MELQTLQNIAFSFYLNSHSMAVRLYLLNIVLVPLVRKNLLTHQVLWCVCIFGTVSFCVPEKFLEHPQIMGVIKITHLFKILTLNMPKSICRITLISILSFQDISKSLPVRLAVCLHTTISLDFN